METPHWIEIEIERAGADLSVTCRGSRGERPPAQALSGVGEERLESFARAVGRFVKQGRALDQGVLGEAQAIYTALFRDGLRDLASRQAEAARGRGGTVLHRLLLRDRALQAIPWEALCEPGTSEGFWGTSPHAQLARGVISPDPCEPREVLGAVRVLAIAPTGEGALQILREVLAEPIAAGEIEWLDPIAGPEASQHRVFEALRRGKSPHVIHYLGHGGLDAGGHPSLRLADDEDGEEVWIKVEALGRELAASFGEDLRLIVLEACEGARPGALGSAAEILARAGADAVVAHLWPVKADAARACSSAFYRALTGAGRSDGDVAASLSAARRSLLLQSAEGLSPVLYLRGATPSIFGYEDRKVVRPKAGRGGSGRPRNVAPALLSLLEKPFSLVAGDGVEADRAALGGKLRESLAESGDGGLEGHSLTALAQRYELRFGPEKLSELFQDALVESIESPSPPILAALARLLPPGVHVTLLWFPLLESALAAKQPDRTIHVVQPALRDSAGKPRVVRRPAGASGWKRETALPRAFDLEREIVVLRLHGGYLPEPRPIFTGAMLTEDHHHKGLLGVGSWADELMGRLRLQPALFLGLSVLSWPHRKLLSWLYDERPTPRGSLALLDLSADRTEPESWENGGGLPGRGRIAALREDPDDLAALLDTLSAPEAAR